MELILYFLESCILLIQIADDDRFKKEIMDKFKTPDEDEGRSCACSSESDSPHAHDTDGKEQDTIKPSEEQDDEEDMMPPSSQFL